MNKADWKTKIHRHLEKKLKERIGTGEWLNHELRFNDSYLLPKVLKSNVLRIAEELDILKGYKQEEKLFVLETLVANLLKTKTRPIQISLHPSNWKKSQYRKIGYSIIDLIKLLEQNNYIDMKKGYHTEKESRQTRIWATKKLLEYCPILSHQVIMSPPYQLVELRDWKNNLIEYKDTNETWRVRTILKRVNDSNTKCDIWYGNHEVTPYLKAIYKMNFSMYGRLHTSGYRHVQGYSGSERKKIRIDGCTVSELDYSGLHPNLLYAAEGIQYEGDPYSIVDDNSDLRLFLKHIFMHLLNSKDFTQAERASNYYLRDAGNKKLLNDNDVFNARPIMEQFIKEHNKIAHYFCSGKKTGMRVMNKDARIALDVVNHFAKQGKPIIPIHDSFIVQSPFEEELFDVMNKVYEKHTKGFKIKVK